MPAIKLTAFMGEQPQVIPDLLPESAGQAAIDARFDDGGLTPIRMSVQTGLANAATDKTIYFDGAAWSSWAGVVSVAPGPVAADRLYITGDGVPKLRVSGTDYPLAVPRPSGALTATLGGSGSGDVVTRVYVYTWVTGFGEESEPSPASNAVDWKPGNTLTLSGFASTPAGRNITKQRIYRSQTGQSGTYFYLIAERTASNGNFSDTVAVDAFQEALPSASWNAPPDDLAGLTAMPNGMMAAFTGRKLYFCEPFRPHAWPEKYVLTVDADIVGLGAIGTSLVVLTKKNPYIVSGANPESMQQAKLEQNSPCINARGIVDLGYAVAFPSHDGLYVVGADGSIVLATAKLFNREKWAVYSPATFVAAQISGRYVAFYDTLDVQGGVLAGALIIDVAAPYLIRTSERVNAVFFDIGTSSLYFTRPGERNIYKFDSLDGRRQQLYWKSKPFRLPFPDNFGVIRIDTTPRSPADEQIDDDYRNAVIAANAAAIAAGPIGGELNGAPIDDVVLNGDHLAVVPDLSQSDLFSVCVYADGDLVRQISRQNAIERLPSGFTAEVWEIDVASTVPVTRILVGKTVADLKQVA